MSEPSDEAARRALEIVSRCGFTGTPEVFLELCTALQALIDQREDYHRLYDQEQLRNTPRFEALTKRAEKAEARLAELVREIRIWLGTPRTGPLDGLLAILRKYEEGEPARSERCKVCGASAPVYCDPDMPGVHSFEPGGEHG